MCAVPAEPEDDRLAIADVNFWSREKHHFVGRYLNAFTTAMKSKNWAALCYVDLFAGSGVERVRDAGTLHWGSPLLAASTAVPFDKILLCEKSREKLEALKSRIARFRVNGVRLWHGDANKKIGAIVKEIPDGSLTAAFLDPYGLHLDFETVALLSERRADLIIFFPDHLDILRNWRDTYLRNPNSNLDRFMGTDDWRSVFEHEPQPRWTEKIRSLYERQLRALGYDHFERERIPAHGRPMYLLIFASRAAVAAKIWRGVSAKTVDQQRSFDFG